MIRSSVDLPPPDGPSSAVSCPVGSDDGDVVEGDEVTELLVDVGDLDAHEAASLGRSRETTTMQSTASRTRTNEMA